MSVLPKEIHRFKVFSEQQQILASSKQFHILRQTCFGQFKMPRKIIQCELFRQMPGRTSASSGNIYWASKFGQSLPPLAKRLLCMFLEHLARIRRHWQVLRCANSKENSWCPVDSHCGEQWLLRASCPRLVLNITAQLEQSPLESEGLKSHSLRLLKEGLSGDPLNGEKKTALGFRMLLTKIWETEPAMGWPLQNAKWATG